MKYYLTQEQQLPLARLLIVLGRVNPRSTRRNLERLAKKFDGRSSYVDLSDKDRSYVLAAVTAITSMPVPDEHKEMIEKVKLVVEKFI